MTFGANTRLAAESVIFSTISSARTMALCRTPASRKPAFSTACTSRSAVSGSAMSPVTTSIRCPAALRSAMAAGNIIAGSRTSVQDNQSRALLGQPARDDEAETAHAADDEVAAVAADQWLRRRGRDRFDAAIGIPSARYRDDDLAGVPTGRHEPKCVGRVVQAEFGDGKYL